MPLRQFFIAFSSFGASIEKFQKFIDESETSSTVFDFDLSMKDEETDKKLLLALRSLIKSSKVFPLEEHTKVFQHHSLLKEIFKENRKFIESFLQWQCQISDWNIHGIFSGSSKLIGDSPNAFGQLQQSIGTGCLLFGSLTNHSCANNVFRIYVEGKVAYSVSRPIQKGSQIFDCYK